MKGVPGQAPYEGVIIYMTLIFAPVVFTSDSFIKAVAPLPAGFEIPGTTALDHAKVAPTVELVAV